MRSSSPLSAILAGLRRHPLGVVFAVALLVRLVNLASLAGVPNAYFAQEDAGRYWEIGQTLAETGHFDYRHGARTQPVTDVLPIYPLLLAGVQAAFGDAPVVVAVLQAVVDAGTCVVVALLGSLLSPAIGWVGGLLAAVSVNLVVHSTQILTDTIFVFFFSLMLLAGARFLRGPSPRLALAAGLAGGLALATRPVVALLLLAAVPLVFGATWRRRRRVVPGVVAVGLFLGAAAIPVAPSLIGNAVRFHHWSLTSQGGHHLMYWIVPMVIEASGGPPYQVSVDRLNAVYRARLAEQGDDETTTDGFRFNAIKAEVAREEIAKLPLSAFARAWGQGMAINMVAPAVVLDPRARALPKPSFYHTAGGSLGEKLWAYVFVDPRLYQLLALGGLIAGAPFLLLQGGGLVILARRSAWAAVLAGGVLAYFLVVNGPVVSPKYRLPMEPVLTVLTAVAVVRLAERGGGARPTR